MPQMLFHIFLYLDVGIIWTVSGAPFMLIWQPHFRLFADLDCKFNMNDGSDIASYSVENGAIPRWSLQPSSPSRSPLTAGKHVLLIPTDDVFQQNSSRGV